jgi:HEAT repeat protein
MTSDANWRQLSGRGARMTLRDRIGKAVSRMPAEDAAAIRRDLETVGQAGINSVEQLVEAIGDRNREHAIRLLACSLVAHLKERSAATALARALAAEDDAGLAFEAAKALIQIRAKNTAPPLVRVLEDRNSSPDQKSAAAYTLGWLGVPNTVPALRAAAMNLDLDAGVRGHAVEALGVMQARDAVSDLISLLSDASPEVRYWTAYALGQIGDPESIPALERMASSDVAVLSWDRSLKQEALDARESIRAKEERSTT